VLLQKYVYQNFTQSCKLSQWKSCLIIIIISPPQSNLGTVHHRPSRHPSLTLTYTINLTLFTLQTHYNHRLVFYILSVPKDRSEQGPKCPGLKRSHPPNFDIDARLHPLNFYCYYLCKLTWPELTAYHCRIVSLY